MVSLTLRPDQMEDFVEIIRKKKFLNGNEPGTGKTPVVIANMWKRWSRDGIRTVWVMPKGLIPKNVKEIKRFSNFTDDDIRIVDGTPKKVAEALASDAKVLLMGPARFRLCWEKIQWKAKKFAAIDVDEFHLCFPGGTSQTTHAFLKAWQRHAVEGVLMSGTFVNGRLDTTWPAIHAIEPRYYPMGYTQFMARHACLDDFGKPLFWREHDRLQAILTKHGSNRSFESIFGKNKPVYQIERLELNAAQLKIYNEFEAQAVVELDKFMLEGTEPGVALIRARQIMDHPRLFPDLTAPGNFIDIVNGELTGKEEGLLAHAEEHMRRGENFIVYSSLVPQQKEIARLLRELGLEVGLMDSSTSTKKRGEIDAAYVAGEVNVVVSSPPIASVGYNWQFYGPKRRETPHIIFASMPYLDGDFIQACARAIRQKRETPLRVTIQTYETEVEDRIFDILERKSRDANKVDPRREVLNFRS